MSSLAMTVGSTRVRYDAVVRGLLVAITLAACQSARAPAPPPPEETRLLAARDLGDVDTMRAHCWQVWHDIQDKWQAWPSSDVVLGMPDRIFRALQPFRIGERMEVETLPLMFAVIYNPEAAAHVAKNRLELRSTLRKRRPAIPAFSRGAIVMKAVWYPVHARGVTELPLWDGESILPEGNPGRTWSRHVAIEPGGEDRVVDGVHHVPLDAFLHRTLNTQAEVAAARTVAHDPSLAIGDHVVIVGMHVSTKEIPDWVWATFWWHDRPDAGPYAAGRPASLTGAAASYLMDVAYSEQTPREPDGSPHVAMNPFLEARFPDGLHSNCVACHQRAAYGTMDYLPITRGTTAPGDPYFADKVTTDFVWSLALEAR
jgi:hypothetical protein